MNGNKDELCTITVCPHHLPASKEGNQRGKKKTRYCSERNTLCKLSKFVPPNQNIDFNVARRTSGVVFLSLPLHADVVEDNLSDKNFKIREKDVKKYELIFYSYFFVFKFRTNILKS